MSKLTCKYREPWFEWTGNAPRPPADTVAETDGRALLGKIDSRSRRGTATNQFEASLEELLVFVDRHRIDLKVNNGFLRNESIQAIRTIAFENRNP